MKLDRKFTLNSGIDPVPVINIFFLVFIFCLLYPVTLKNYIYNINSYRTSPINEPVNSEALIYLSGTGRMLLNRGMVTRDDIGLKLRELIIKNNNITVIINPDSRVPYGLIMEVINTARLSGAKNIRLASAAGEE